MDVCQVDYDGYYDDGDGDGERRVDDPLQLPQADGRPTLEIVTWPTVLDYDSDGSIGMTVLSISLFEEELLPSARIKGANVK
ncbi:MAG: hypothetical protein GY820_21915 [Gammaproteobacteria bacterium]|nr:hypothetical protein [Gammaproteobacteria bacterium]